MKYCKKCDETKLKFDFGKNKNTKDGLQFYCKSCCGDNVSGLHVPWNLQVLPADVNIAKGNRYDPDDIYSRTAKGDS